MAEQLRFLTGMAAHYKVTLLVVPFGAGAHTAMDGAFCQVTPDFRTWSYSSSQDNCVEVADLPTGAAIRDSKHSELGFLSVGAAEWVAFTRLVAGDA